MADSEVTDEEIALVTPILHRLLWADSATRAKLQNTGVNVIPCNFYSDTPSIEEIEGSFEFDSQEPPYLNSAIFDEKRLKQTLERLLQFSDEFNPPTDGDEDGAVFFWKNTMFSYSDAMAYYCFVRMLKPATVLEIGSGFSTLIALEATEKNQTGSVQCIEPFPRDFLRKDNRITLHDVKAQKVELEFLNDSLQDGDILFIDSTHTVKCGSDCLHIYLRLLPKVRRNIFVHVHDVFLPYGMPKHWLLNHTYWTEQYLLFAFLIDNRKASLVYGSTINLLLHSQLMQTFMGGKFGPGGASVWFAYNGQP